VQVQVQVQVFLEDFAGRQILASPLKTRVTRVRVPGCSRSAIGRTQVDPSTWTT